MPMNFQPCASSFGELIADQDRFRRVVDIVLNVVVAPDFRQLGDIERAVVEATPLGRCRSAAITLTSRLPSFSRTAWTLPTRREPTNTVPLSLTRISRALATPLAKTSTLKPSGALSSATGREASSPRRTFEKSRSGRKVAPLKFSLAKS